MVEPIWKPAQLFFIAGGPRAAEDTAYAIRKGEDGIYGCWIHDERYDDRGQISVRIRQRGDGKSYNGRMLQSEIISLDYIEDLPAKAKFSLWSRDSIVATGELDD